MGWLETSEGSTFAEHVQVFGANQLDTSWINEFGAYYRYGRVEPLGGK